MLSTENFFLLLKRKALFHHTVNNKSVHISEVDFLCESVDCVMKQVSVVHTIYINGCLY